MREKVSRQQSALIDNGKSYPTQRQSSDLREET